ncbi:MAG: hypothetical protein JO061_17290, partial [Acidobacteriaceae bacterium]|nr:hypothetical protein [Acidobacteriaceae bacterium]
YTGIDQALSLLRSPPSERVQALERYPDRTNMPAALVYELALNLAEAGDVDKAIALFHNRFFPREEGGTNVRQIWVEVRLQQALDLTRNGHCDAATHDAGSLGEADAALPFTQNGLNPFLHAARTEYLLGSLFRECGKAEDAAQHFRNAEKQNGLGDVPWAYKAAQVLDPHIDWGPRLTEALARAKVNAKTSSYSGLWDYIAGEVAGELGNRQTADSLYHAALLAPDRMMSHHLSRLALAVDSSRTITRKSTS